MKFLVPAFIIVGVAAAAVFEIPTNELLLTEQAEQHVSSVEAQANDNFLPSVLEVPQLRAEPQQSLGSAMLADDSYQYKVVRRTKYRHRGDVSELPQNNVNFNSLKQYQVVVEPQDITPQASNIYQRLADQPSNVYLPPYQESKDAQIADLPTRANLPLLKQYQIVVEPQDITPQALNVHQLLANQPSNEYLPPYQTNIDVQTAVLHNTENLLPLKQHQIVVEPQDIAPESSNLHNRPDNQPSNQYMPPKQLNIDVRFADLPTTEHLTPMKQHQVIVESQDFTPHGTAILADQFFNQNQPTYQDKENVRVGAQTENDAYLHPVLEVPHTLNDHEKQDTAILAADGYHYKIGFRHRRDVNELPSNEYLPPTKQYKIVAEPLEVVPQESAVLADDGYRYKVVRRNIYRQRRV